MSVWHTLPEAIGLRPSGELIALVGGGGKTSLLFALSGSLSGGIILTTTTRIFAAQMKLAQEVAFFAAESAAHTEQKIGEAVGRTGSCLVVGELAGDKALGVPPELPGRWLARPDVDFVLVEADGSRMRPIKAPAAHEPVIPPEATVVVPVVGIDALNGRFEQVTHRPDLAAALLQWPEFRQQLAVEDIARLIVHPQGGLKGVPAKARVVPFINKAETAEQQTAARQIGQQLLQSPRIDRVVIGAARTDRPARSVIQRVTAVILAAGQSQRMGQTKQLLPWGQTTVLGQTLRNLGQSGVHQRLVITGQSAAAVAAIARAEGVESLHNPNFAAGEMLSSLQTAVRHLPESCTAVLVVLADQPMVPAQEIDLLLQAYWQGRSDLIAPLFGGQRGNPVLIGRAYFAELLALPPGDAPRTLLRQHADRLLLVPMPSDATLRDLDHPEQYQIERQKWEAENEHAT